ncbi:MAG TPA: flagellar basal body L-ring protein FlgH [Phycisphaerae bacterium]|nr:flagellar basal body L-ring protein FlgH [Phycisphaerae bacterium]
MRSLRSAVLVLLIMLPFAPQAMAQTSSLSKRVAGAEPASAGPQAPSAREASEPLGNPLLERHSLIAVKVKPPKKFKVHDIVTIIVRQQKKFEADSELETKKDFDIKSELEAFFKPIDGGLGATTFYRGKPNVDYKFGLGLKTEGDNTREDLFVTRISGTIVDIKPNGNLVIEAVSRVQHDEEIARVTLTGQCRSTDLTPDNTVLSTQLAGLRIDVQNEGAIKDAATRGWIPQLLDFLKPI